MRAALSSGVMTTAKQETIPLHRGSFIATARYQLREKLENKRFYRSSSDVIALFYVIWIVIKMVTHFMAAFTIYISLIECFKDAVLHCQLI